MISGFFINRPIFACVIAILISLAGLFALKTLPVEQYPNIVPPQIVVTAFYTGADAKTISENVAAPLEQQINGVEGMIYMNSQCSANGEMSLTVFFNIGTDVDMAQVNVQNRVNLAMPLLPRDVVRTGVTVQKQTPNMLLIAAVQSPDGRYDDIYTSNFASINIVDELMRVEGVSSVSIFGGRDYSMRLWVQPDRLAQYGLTTNDVVNAVREQNEQYPVGRIGQPPNENPVQLSMPVTTKGRLNEPEEYDNIILKANLDGSLVFLRDVGYAELGALSYDVNGQLNGKSTTLIAVYQQYGANALDVGERVRSTLERISHTFPKGIEYAIPYDTTKFIEISIKEVAKTILEAAVLVTLVVFIFLQNFRATLIPLIAMVVSIIGTFAGMQALGFSINTLTLFGLVLAVGIVVDDAIVVIENVERNMRELGLSSKQAAIKAMEEVTGPVIAIVFVLCAVFVPVAFTGGIAGQLYKQFAITIAISVIISGIVALTLSPALAAFLLKKHVKPSRFALWFNKNFDQFTSFYMKGANWILVRTAVAAALFIFIIAASFLLFKAVPSSFVPSEDQGWGMVMTTLPDGSSLQRTMEVDKVTTDIALQQPGVENVISFAGFSLMDGVMKSSSGASFLTFVDWSKRNSSDLSSESILNNLFFKYRAIKEAQVFAFNPPAIQGLGTVGGFEFWVLNKGASGIQGLESAVQKLVQEANKRPELQGVSTTFSSDSMQLFVDLDRQKAKALGVNISDVYQTLQVLLGSLYINDFNKFGRTYRVMMQAPPEFRSTLNDIGEFYVRSNLGKMVPLKSILKVEYRSGPAIISRFNGFTAIRVNGSAAPGYSSGVAMDIMEQLAKEIFPQEIVYAWGGESYQEKVSGGASSFIFIAGLIMVFLILSALYERWSLPLAILLAVPFGVFGALIAIWVSGMSNDIYFQVGLVTLIALSAKNAILIVEFGILKRQEGKSIIESSMEAARLRFRAILMTSLTFIFGVVPLVLSSGAGAASRHSVGTGVLGGMIGATVLAVFFVPLFFKIIEQYTERRKVSEIEGQV